MLRDKLSNSLEKFVLQPKDSFPTFMLIFPSGLIALTYGFDICKNTKVCF